jgi:hypothetical protein
VRLALALVLLVAASARAWADPIEDRFNDAANRIAEERYDDAARQLEALAGEAPDHRLAPEALFTAAEIREDHLNDPAAALALYRKIETTYPDSRPALASARRAETLQKQIGEQQEGLEPQRRFTEIREGFPERPEEQSIAMTEQLLRDFPDWVGAPSVAMWLAEVDLRAGRADSAMRRYAAAADRYRTSDARFDALLGATEAALQIGRTSDAQRFIDMMDTAGDPGRQALRRDALRQLSRVAGRSQLALVAALVAAGCLLLLAGSLWRATGSPALAVRALWPPPVELLYLTPVAAFLSAAAFTGYEGLGPSVTAICAAGMAAAWLSGSGLAVRRAASDARRVAAVVVHSLAACAIVLAVAYCALRRFELLDPVLDTLRNGPDR